MATIYERMLDELRGRMLDELKRRGLRDEDVADLKLDEEYDAAGVKRVTMTAVLLDGTRINVHVRLVRATIH